jgi:hypothetical protein
MSTVLIIPRVIVVAYLLFIPFSIKPVVFTELGENLCSVGHTQTESSLVEYMSNRLES